jgi:hypothetical protein
MEEELPNYLGVFRILYVETDRHERAKRTDLGRAVAAGFDCKWLSQAEPLVMDLGTMLIGIRTRPSHQEAEAHALDLVFVGGRRDANEKELGESDPYDPFLLTLPEMALCHLKVRNSAANLRNHWLPGLADRERQLRNLLPKPGQARPTLLQMLDRNDDITTWQAELVEAVAQVEAELRTMRINRDNFVAAATEPFHRLADKLRHVLIDRWMRGTEGQAENDLGYIQGTLQLAESHFRSIAASAEAEQARQLKRINRWVIVLGGLQVVVALVSAFLAWKALAAPTSSTPPATQPGPTTMPAVVPGDVPKDGGK